MSNTVVKPCRCVHDYQDKKYGVWQRVMNVLMKDRRENGWRCTVCAAVQK